MEKVKKFNFDYELELYGMVYNPLKVNSRLDHFIPWYASEFESFIHYTKYTPAFLNYVERKLKRKLGTFIENTSAKEVECIWGKVSPFAKLMNSRFHSLEMAKELKLFSPSEIVLNETEFLSYIKKHSCENYVIKDECSVSGRGTRVLKSLTGEGLSYPIRIEPLYDRAYDLGVSAYFENHQYIIKGYFKNRISDSFAVQGGVFYRDLNDFCADYQISTDLQKSFCEQVEKILEHYLALGVEGDFQFDNFFFLNELNELQIYPLVEVNYRKTLANFLMNFNEASYLEWTKVHLKSSLSYKKINELDENNIFVIGPEGQTNIDIIIACNNKDEAYELKQKILAKPLVDFIY
jgi:hypothetical protein